MTGRHNVTIGLLIFGLAAASACSEGRAATVQLKDGAAAACDSRQPLLLRVNADGGYAVNGLAMDSTQLVTSLRTALPPRANRVVMVDAAPHERALPWIIAAIERGGGVAYQPDDACVLGAPPPWWRR